MLRHLASTNLQAGRLDEAESLYQRILTENPKDIDAIKALIAIHTRKGRSDLVLLDLKGLVDAEPDNVNAITRLGREFQQQGQLQDARRCFQRALESDPERSDLRAMLANISRHTEYTDEIAELEKWYRRSELTSSQRRELAFALGKIFDDLKNYDKAFGYFGDGNRIAEQVYGQPIGAMSERNRKVRDVFTHQFVRDFKDAGINDDSIILVTGLARSGTTLVEAILASHSQIFGAGEAGVIFPTMKALFGESALPYPEGATRLTAGAIQAKAQDYVRQLKERSGNSPYIVDKNMGMEPFIGLYTTMLPNAKLIHCNRDPRDQGLSYFTKDFGPQQPYCYNLRSIGLYARLYREQIEYWQKLLPGRIYQLNYEDVVADIEKETRGLLEFCGLDFEPACLRFHESDTKVRTASLEQVRRPIYGASVGRWRNYEKQLEPLISVIESAD